MDFETFKFLMYMDELEREEQQKESEEENNHSGDDEVQNS